MDGVVQLYRSEETPIATILGRTLDELVAFGGRDDGLRDDGPFGGEDEFGCRDITPKDDRDDR